MKKVLENNPNTREYWDKEYEGPHDGTYSIFLNILVANQLLPKTKVIDFGCGKGSLLKAISGFRPDCELYGIDFSIEGIERARDNVLGANFLVNDVYNTPFSPESFDCATSIEVLEHLDEPERMVKEMARVLKTGGIALLTTPWHNLAPSDEHLWDFEVDDVGFMFSKYFSKVYPTPIASSRGIYSYIPGGEVEWEALPGELDTIYVRAEK